MRVAIPFTSASARNSGAASRHKPEPRRDCLRSLRGVRFVEVYGVTRMVDSARFASSHEAY